MDIRQKVIELHQNGILLWVSEGKLHYKCHRKLKEEELSLLKEQKQEMIEVLQSASPQLIHQSSWENEHAPYPLTDIQSAYLLGRGEHFEYGGVSSHVYFEVLFPRLDQNKTEEAWNYLIKRHDNLRLVITEDRQQRVLKNVPPLTISFNHGDQEELESIRKTLSDQYYDVARWPLFDVAVSQQGDKSLMHLSFDFLILDWTSIWMALKEFEQIYFGSTGDLEEIEDSFKHYFQEALQQRMSSQYLVDEDYWKERIQSFYEPPVLPRAAGTAGSGFDRLSSRLDEMKWNAIKKLAAQEGLTPTAVLVTAFSLCLEGWCEKPEFSLNLTTMNRKGSNAKIAKLLGDFTSVNLLNIHVNRKAAFTENAKSVQTELAQNMEHDLFTGIEVLRELRRRHENKSYFMPIVFTSAVGTIGNQYDYLEMGAYGISQTPQVFLDCQVMEVNRELQINWDIRNGVFPEQLMEHALEKYQEVLHQLAEAQDWSQIDNLQMLVKQELHERIQANDTAVETVLSPIHMDILKQIDNKARDIAVVKGDKVTTYGELGDRVSGISLELGKLGLKDNELVGIFMHHSAVEVAAVLSVLSLGGAYVPLDLQQPVERTNDILAQTNLRYVLMDSASCPIRNQRITVIDCSELSSPLAINPVSVSCKENAYVIFTSGTTGTPKGVVISHLAAANTINGVYEKLSMPARPVVLGLSKLNFDLSVFDIFGILSKGGTVVYPEDENRLNPEHWLSLIRKYDINLWNSVPAFMQLLVACEGVSSGGLPLQVVMLSGDWIPVSLPEEVKKITEAAQVVSLGGATEAAIWSIYHICRAEDKEGKSIPYGIPLTNQSFHVLDPELRDRPMWVPGELYIGGIGLAKEYLGDEVKTRESFLSHPITGERIYRTGDFGRYLPGGEIEFLGRRDNQIKMNGFRIELGEIESGLLRDPKIKEACVVLNAEGDDKQLVGFVCPQERQSEAQAIEAAETLLEKLKIYSQNYQSNIQQSKSELQRITEIRDTLSINALWKALQHYGFFVEDKEYKVDDILTEDKGAADKNWILHYYIQYLYRWGYLRKTGDNEYRFHTAAEAWNDSKKLWDDLKGEWSRQIGDQEFINYLEESISQLVKCFEGSVNPVHLLYPEGSTKIVEAIYENNLFSRYFNSCIAELITNIGQQYKLGQQNKVELQNKTGLQNKLELQKKTRRLRILEVGAGTGITSKHVLRHLAEAGVEYEYYFTDNTNSFIARAKTNLSAYPNVHYGIYDMNYGYEEQGFLSNEFDIILAVGVFENAKEISATIAWVKEMLSINGWLIFTEPIVEEPWILASQIFMMEKPEDGLRKEEAYLNLEEWLDLLQKDGEKGRVFVLPEENDKLVVSNMRLFARQFNVSYEMLEEAELLEGLKNHVPDYMVPRQVRVLKHLPLNNNGKIDRDKLIQYSKLISARGAMVKESDEHGNETGEQDQLTRDLCEIVAPILGLKNLDSRRSLYEYGADSLLMAQASGKVKDYLKKSRNMESISFDMILRQLLNSPNINALTVFLQHQFARTDHKARTANETRTAHETRTAYETRTAHEARTAHKATTAHWEITDIPPDDPIGKLTFYGGGEGPLRVIFHAGFGTMNSMRYVIEALVKQGKGTVVGITINNNDRYCKLPAEELVAVISEEYARLILDCKPTQLQLIGYCLGGLIAVESAHHFLEAGIDIIDISLIDSYPSPFQINDPLISEAIFLPNYFTTYGTIFPQITDEFLMKKIEEAFEHCDGIVGENHLLKQVKGETESETALKELLEELSKLSEEERFEIYANSITTENNQAAGKELLLATYRTNQASWKGANMIPYPYFGTVRFLLAEEKIKFLFADVEETLNFWKTVCFGEFHVIPTKGNHVTCAEDKNNAKGLAEILGKP